MSIFWQDFLSSTNWHETVNEAEFPRIIPRSLSDSLPTKVTIVPTIVFLNVRIPFS